MLELCLLVKDELFQHFDISIADASSGGILSVKFADKLVKNTVYTCFVNYNSKIPLDK